MIRTLPLVPELRNPEVRERIIELLDTFASADAQAEAWQTPHDFEDDAQDLIDAVAGIPGTDVRMGIGDVFVGTPEADAAGYAIRELDAVWSDLNPVLRLEHVQSHPDWPRVMAAALAARATMTSG